MCEYMLSSIGWYSPPPKKAKKGEKEPKGKVHLEEPGWICTHPRTLTHPQRLRFVTDEHRHVVGVRIGIVCHTCKGTWERAEKHDCHSSPGMPKMTQWREGPEPLPPDSIIPPERYAAYPPHPLSIYDMTPEERFKRNLYQPAAGQCWTHKHIPLTATS